MVDVPASLDLAIAARKMAHRQSTVEAWHIAAQAWAGYYAELGGEKNENRELVCERVRRVRAVDRHAKEMAQNRLVRKFLREDVKRWQYGRCRLCIRPVVKHGVGRQLCDQHLARRDEYRGNRHHYVQYEGRSRVWHDAIREVSFCVWLVAELERTVKQKGVDHGAQL